MFNTRAKKERALSTPLFLKPFRSASGKSAVTRRPTRPGQHGAARRRAGSEFAEQLAEKQKFQFAYGLRENQMRRLFTAAKRDSREATGKGLIALLERRLDNTVFRLGLAPSRSVARQLINHGHIQVNGRRVKASSYQVKSGDKITIREASKGAAQFQNLDEQLTAVDRPSWLEMDLQSKEGVIKNLPVDIEMPFDISKVVDYYSKNIK